MKDRKMRQGNGRGAGLRGFTLIELLVVIAIVALLISIILPALGEARRTARSVLCSNNMRQLAVATTSYATDFQDRIASFTWGVGQPGPTSDTQLQGPYDDDIAAAAAQAIDILRRRSGRGNDLDLQGLIGGWIPHILYSHLVLQDFLAQRLPEISVVCPEDRNRRNWQQIREFEQAAFTPNQPAPGGVDDAGGGAGGFKRWPYSSSYEFVPASYSPDSVRGGSTVTQGPRHNQFSLVGSAAGTRNDLGRRRLPEVLFPSQKVFLMDSQGRHQRRELYFTYPEVRQPLAFFDTSVRVEETGPRNTADQGANDGWQPDVPTDPNPTLIRYEPSTTERWESRPKTGLSFTAPGFYRWTRGGLRGIDFDGPEVIVR